jgi:poly-gamma-glutamate capsule biosynthesis protein CapA/YwtB (metallophosphatase superfamily)
MPRSPLTLAAIGDVMPGRRLYRDGEPVTKGLAGVAGVLGAADVAVGNMDGVLSRRGYPREKLITIRADPAEAADYAQLGFDVISVANNHGTDYGETGLFDTLEALESAGIRPVGGGADLARATAPVVLEQAGWRIGVTAWTACLPTGAAAGPGRPGLAPLHVHTSYEVNPLLLMEEPASVPTVRSAVDAADLAAARDAVARLRDDVDFVVALVHWGGGLSEGLVEYQRPLGHALVDAGADIVVGAHPHRPLGIERYAGKAILYSPGTLVDLMDRSVVPEDLRPLLASVSPDSFIATLDIAPAGGYSIRITPVTVDGDGVPMVAEEAVFDRIAERLVGLSADLGTDVRVAGEELIADFSAAVAI